MTAEELLMMSDDVEVYSTDDALVIDAENRIILTPAGGLLLGVESDEEAERIKFICPRIVGDNIDLSTLQLRAIYRNANGDKDFRICTDITIDGSYIRFSWSLSRKVTRYKGTVKFIICAIRTQSDGSIKNEWNTTLAEGKVLEGLEVDISEEEFEEPKDIVLQLLGMLDEKEAELLEEVENLRTDVKADIETTKQKAMDDVEAKGVETLKTIPEDYTYIANLAEENKQLKANAIKCTYSGETIVATDSSGVHLEGLRVFGRSEQVSTTGAQLGYIDIAYNEHNGLNFIEDNGNIIVNGTSTSTMWNRLIRCELVGGEKYTLSANENLNLNIWDFTSSSSLGDKSFGKTSKTFTAPNTGQYGIVLGGEAYALSNIKANIMVNIGTEALPYEPYTGGKPSPSPEYPQPIESVGDDGSVDVGVYGKNLISYPYNVSNGTINGITYTTNSDGSITLNGTAEERFEYYIKNINLPEGKYIMNGCPEGGDSATYGLSVYYNGDKYVREIGNGLSFKVTSDGSAYATRPYIVVNKGVTASNLTFYPMIRIDSVSNDTYEPYKPKQLLSVSTPNGLPAIKVTDASLATYTDADGNMWCADEVDFVRGKYVQRIGTKICSRVIATGANSSGETAYTVAFGNIDDMVSGNWLGCFCDCFRNEKQKENNVIRCGANDKSVNVYTDDILFATAETANEYLAENPITVSYILENPIETDLSAEEIEAYKALTSNYPTTTIMNDENAHMEVTLVADTKNHIEQNYVPLESYKSLETRVLAVEQALA